MTKTQRKKHINNLDAILIDAGATQDRWGMYHIGEYKFDTRKVNMKIYKSKIKISSKPMVDVSVEGFQSYVNEINK